MIHRLTVDRVQVPRKYSSRSLLRPKSRSFRSVLELSIDPQRTERRLTHHSRAMACTSIHAKFRRRLPRLSQSFRAPSFQPIQVVRPFPVVQADSSRSPNPVKCEHFLFLAQAPQNPRKNQTQTRETSWLLVSWQTTWKALYYTTITRPFA